MRSRSAKSTGIALVSLLAAVFLFGAGAQNSSRAAAEPILSAAEIDYPPFCIVDAEGRPGGFSVELMRAALAAMDRQVTFRTGTWTRVRGWLVRGQVQALPLVGRTPEREAIFDFTFSEGLKTLENSGEYQRIYDKWLGVYAAPSAEIGQTVRGLAVGVALLLAILLGMFAWTRALRRQVAKKTAELHQVAAKFRDVFEAANVGKSVTLPSGEINVNQAFADFLGYRREELAGKTWQDITPADDIANVQQRLDRLLAGKQEAARFEKRYIRKDGTSAWADVSTTLRRDENGRPLYFLTTIVDIGARKEAEEMQHRLQARLTQAVNIARLGYWECDVVQDRFIFDDAFYKIYRTSADQVGGYTMTPQQYADRFLHPEDRNLVAEENRKALETNDPAYSRKMEHRILYADGTVGWISVRFFIVKDEHGKTVKTYGVNQDITERKQAEQEIIAREKRARLQRTALAQLATEHALVSTDPTPVLGRITQIISDTIGVARASIWRLADDRSQLHCLSLYETDTHRSGDTLDPTTFPAYFEALKAESRIYAEDAQNDPRTRELAEFYLKPLGITSLLDSAILIQGELLGVVSFEHIGPMRKWHADEESFASTIAAIVAQFFTNIERKRAEAERVKLQGQLIQAQKMESVGRLAGGVAHDFNNMLGVILGYAELALDKVAEDDPLHADLAEIVTAARRSADITRQLLAFARRQTIAPRVLDLNDTVEGMLRMLRRLIGEDIDLQWLPEGGLWPVKIDPTQVDQLLANLCVNARDAIAGVGKLIIETENVHFDPQYCRDHLGFVAGDYVLLAVSDDGCGMDAETRDHLFEPFFTTKEAGQGTGLGLATVYGIVKQNSGFINVYSEPGAGTTFKIYLPRHAETAETLPAALQRKAGAGRGETILVVEDEASVLKLACAILEGLGYHVLAATDPLEAERLVGEHGGTIDLLITDVVMPQMNGRQLAERIQAVCPDLKTLFMSGYTADVIAHHGVLENGVYFIQKPFSRQELAARVREALG